MKFKGGMTEGEFFAILDTMSDGDALHFTTPRGTRISAVKRDWLMAHRADLLSAQKERDDLKQKYERLRLDYDRLFAEHEQGLDR